MEFPLRKPQSVFYDEFAIQFFDAENNEEDRFILLGISNQSYAF